MKISNIENVIKSKIFVRHSLVCLSIFLLVSWKTRGWFTPGYTITNTDLAYPIRPYEELLDRFSAFSQQRNLGTFLGNNFAGMPQRLYEYLILEFFPDNGQIIEFVILNLLIAYSALYLLNSIFDIYSNWESSLTALIVTLTQVWSVYLAFVWVRLQTIIFACIFLQFSIGVILRFYSRKTSVVKSLSLFSILAFLFGSSLGTQPPILVSSFSFFLVLVLYLWIFLKKEKSDDAKGFILFAISLGTSYSILNCWWVLPLLQYSMKNDFFNSATVLDNFDVSNLVSLTSRPTTIFNNFRQIGDFAWFEGYWPNINPFLENSTLIILSLIPIFFILLGILDLRAASRSSEWFLVRFFSLVFLLSLVLSLGNLGPLGEFYDWSLENLPLFSLQRAPWQKFAFFTWLASSILFYWGTVKSIRFFASRGSSLGRISVFVTLLTTLSLGPTSLVANGAMYSKAWGTLDGWHEKENFGYHIKVPDYVLKASKYIDREFGQSGILLLPDSTVNAYIWGWGAPWDLTWQTLRTGVAQRNYGQGLLPPSSEVTQNAIIQLFERAANGDVRGFLCDSERLGISGFLVRNDFNLRYVRGSSFKVDEGLAIEKKGFAVLQAWRNFLTENRGFIKDREFGPWTIYKSDSNIYPRSRSVYLTHDTKTEDACGNTSDKIVDFKYSRNIQDSYRTLSDFDSKNILRVHVNEQNNEKWKVYVYSPTKNVIATTQYLNWYNNLLFQMAHLAGEFPGGKYIENAIYEKLNIQNLRSLPKSLNDHWDFIPRKGDVVLVSFSGDQKFVLGLLVSGFGGGLLCLSLVFIALYKRIRKQKTQLQEVARC